MTGASTPSLVGSARIADVYVGAALAAKLVRDDHSTTLRYVNEPAMRISFALAPGHDVTSPAGSVPPFFAGLLPEGFRLTALLRGVKLSSDDHFGLLLEVGGDCIGDVSVVPEGETVPVRSPAARAIDLSAISWPELLEDRLGADSRDLDRVGIAGVQPKVSATDMITLFDRFATLKFSPAGLPLLVENEAFFMQMARACGLRTARTELIRDRDGRSALTVARFDRFRKQRRDHKTHVEDACQFLGRYPADKYNLTYNEIADGITQFASAPPLAILDFVELIAFSFLVGNGDLHAKNISLWRRPGTEVVELSPAYDIVSTIAYRGNDRMALVIDGRDDDIRRRDLLDFAARYAVGAKALHRRLDRICDAAPAFADRVGEIGYDAGISDRLRRELLRRRDLLS
jgi:serine/threonine-protein kinase HipA